MMRGAKDGGEGSDEIVGWRGDVLARVGALGCWNAAEEVWADGSAFKRLPQASTGTISLASCYESIDETHSQLPETAWYYSEPLDAVVPVKLLQLQPHAARIH